MRRYLFLLFVLLNDLFPVLAVDANLKNEWSQSGSNYSVPATAKKISILEFGGKADNATDNSTALQNAIKSLNGNSGVIEIPAGNFLIKKTISIPSNILIKGKGSDKTILNFNLNGIGDLFSVQ